MLHSSRVWCVAEVATPEELAANMTSTTWCCCAAFRIAGYPNYVWVNDATSEDGAQEYGVCRIDPDTGSIRQVESITFSWTTYESALEMIRSTLAGHDDTNDWFGPATPTLQTAEEHDRCRHCA